MVYNCGKKSREACSQKDSVATVNAWKWVGDVYLALYELSDTFFLPFVFVVWTTPVNVIGKVHCASETLSIKQYWPQNVLLLYGPVLCEHVVVPSSITTVALCSLSVGWTDLVMRAPCALPVSYGAVGPNWMRTRLAQPSLLIILITLTQIRAGCWDLSSTHKGHSLLWAQLYMESVCNFVSNFIKTMSDSVAFSGPLLNLTSDNMFSCTSSFHCWLSTVVSRK